MELTINDGGDKQALEQFYHWLRSDTDVVRSSSISTAGAQGAGHMGTFDVICMSIGSLTGLGSLALAWASFLQSRKVRPPFTITLVGSPSKEQLEMLRNLGIPLETDPDGDA